MYQEQNYHIASLTIINLIAILALGKHTKIITILWILIGIYIIYETTRISIQKDIVYIFLCSVSAVIIIATILYAYQYYKLSIITMIIPFALIILFIYTNDQIMTHNTYNLDNIKRYFGSILTV